MQYYFNALIWMIKKIGKNNITYWVVGRLFYMPHPKEVYICYQDSIPQNIIEIAFKMNIGALC
ncbi:hypothetical protein NQ317_018121 [Molorchus minor]|uniref:CCZ1/INTU/HPS4 third Longin domain-containing protein n=1 Tax=Molorchus minor TaxID=1323400 RepID=A0ABQ9J018_9CUCU|nr:hypothetical protein NQ317_018121 [Molorchus minor]